MVGDVGPRSPRGTATAPGAALPRSPMGSSASLRSERRAWLRPGPEHWRLRQELEHGKGSKPVTETATCVDRRSTARPARRDPTPPLPFDGRGPGRGPGAVREKRNKTKKDVTPKQDCCEHSSLLRQSDKTDGLRRGDRDRERTEPKPPAKPRTERSAESEIPETKERHQSARLNASAPLSDNLRLDN